MSNSFKSYASSVRNGSLVPAKSRVGRLQDRQQALEHRINDLRDDILEKEQSIKAQRKQVQNLELALYRQKQNNSTLRHIVEILKKYITDDLEATLPPLPEIDHPDELEPPDQTYMKAQYNPLPKLKKKPSSLNRSMELSRGSIITKQPLTNIAPPSRPPPEKNFTSNIFTGFNGADGLRSIIDAQLQREDIRKIINFLLGNASKELFIHKTKMILFESFSLFLSLRNFAIDNSVDIFLPRCMEMIQDIIEAERVTLYLYDSNQNILYCKAVTADLPKRLEFRPDFGHLGIVKDQVVIIPQAQSDPRYDSSYDQEANLIAQNIICVPLKMKNSVVGILECVNKPTQFQREDILVLVYAARQFSIGFVNIQTKNKMRKLMQGIDQQAKAKDALLMPVISQLCEAAKVQLNCDRISVFLHDEKNNEMYSIIAQEVEQPIRVPLTKGLVSVAFTTNSLINVDTAETHPMFNYEIDLKTGYGTREVLAAPFSRGVIQCLNKTNMVPFTKSDENKLLALCEVFSRIFESAENLDGILLNSDINELCINTISDAVLQVNADGQIIKINRAFNDMFGMKVERIVGSSIVDLFSESEDMLEDMRRVLQGDELSAQGRKLKIQEKMNIVDVSFKWLGDREILMILICKSKNAQQQFLCLQQSLLTWLLLVYNIHMRFTPKSVLFLKLLSITRPLKFVWLKRLKLLIIELEVTGFPRNRVMQAIPKFCSSHLWCIKQANSGSITNWRAWT